MQYFWISVKQLFLPTSNNISLLAYIIVSVCLKIYLQLNKFVRVTTYFTVLLVILYFFCLFRHLIVKK